MECKGRDDGWQGVAPSYVTTLRGDANHEEGSKKVPELRARGMMFYLISKATKPIERKSIAKKGEISSFECAFPDSLVSIF